MAFVLSQSPSYTWKVKYQRPRSDGKFDKDEFTAEFNRLPQSRLDELQRAPELDDERFIDEILLDWSGIQAKDGDDLVAFPFNATNKKILLDFQGMRKAIIDAFFESLAGAARKNF